MRLENIVVDARDPQLLGGFWTAALGAEVITDGPGILEARVALAGDAFLDLCFPHVADPSTAPPRLRPAVRGGAERLLGLGAAVTDGGLADPEGNPFGVREDGGTGPLAALTLDSADPDRDVAFWAELTGWVPADGLPTTLRHPAGVGPLLELRAEPEPKRGKSRLHLDVRRAAGENDPTERLVARGAHLVGRPDGLPWIRFADPSGNELCVLDPPREPVAGRGSR